MYSVYVIGVLTLLHTHLGGLLVEQGALPCHFPGVVPLQALIAEHLQEQLLLAAGPYVVRPEIVLKDDPQHNQSLVGVQSDGELQSCWSLR